VVSICAQSAHKEEHSRYPRPDVSERLMEDRVSKSEAEETLALHIRARGLPQPERQYKFAAPDRKWAADFAWPDHRLCVEVEGFGHHKLNRYFGDVEKYNEMTQRGWWLLRVTSAMVKDGRAYQTLERFFGMWRDRSWEEGEEAECDGNS